MRFTKRLWTPEVRARRPLKLGSNTILAIMRHGCSIQTATISRSSIKANPARRPRSQTTARSRPESLSNAEHFVTADVSTVEGCAAVTDAVRDRLGGLDIVVHVVGGSAAPAGGFAVLDDDEWHKALHQNLFAAVRLDRALLP